jgi:hypothetical protein
MIYEGRERRMSSIEFTVECYLNYFDFLFDKLKEAISKVISLSSFYFQNDMSNCLTKVIMSKIIMH